jgi:hypothetical protein
VIRFENATVVEGGELVLRRILRRSKHCSGAATCNAPHPRPLSPLAGRGEKSAVRHPLAANRPTLPPPSASRRSPAPLLLRRSSR